MNELLHPIKTIKTRIGRWIFGPDYQGPSNPKKDDTQPTPFSTLFGGVSQKDWCGGQTPKLGTHPEHRNV
ncbi:hypothetical protein MUP56_02705 [Patescibacteria group bacterium]|nr:hypothetical protein [Patescibacteria group bacterium]